MVAARGGVQESVHRVIAAVVDADGRLVRSWGDIDRITLLRSAAKPFQALPLVEDGVDREYGLTEPEIALCAASHNSEDVHIEAAASILAKIGLEEAHLFCGSHPPLLPGREAEIVASGGSLSPIMSNCSGKHAGMLALAVHHGWKVDGYQRMEHPVQHRMASEIARWSGVHESSLAREVDGCGVPCFGVPVKTLALATARFAAASAAGGSAGAIVNAMMRNPFMVAGTGRLCTALMSEPEVGVFAKVGAEGVYIAGSPKHGIGVALKVEDGAWRAAPPALLGVLSAVDLLADDALIAFRSPAVLNTVGSRVGRLSVRL